MPDFALPSDQPRRPRRARWIAWRVGWLLLAMVSFCDAYAVLVVGGR